MTIITSTLSNICLGNGYTYSTYSDTSCTKLEYSTSLRPNPCATGYSGKNGTFYAATTCTSTPPPPSPLPTPVPTQPPAACFAASESVTLRTGEARRIADVKVGDVILTSSQAGTLSFSTVIAVPHGPNLYPATFTSLTTSSGRDIKLTADHLLPISTSSSGRCEGRDEGRGWRLLKASHAEIGDCLITVDGTESILNVSSILGKGVYSAITMDEFIIVNGVIASPFASNHAVAHAYYNVQRWLFRLSPSLVRWQWWKRANELFGSLALSVAS